jgi:hypothetical protein
MGRLLDRLKRDHPAYRLETNEDGLTLIRRDGREEEFNRLARQLINEPDHEVLVLPSTDGTSGYDRLLLVPFDAADPGPI